MIRTRTLRSHQGSVVPKLLSFIIFSAVLYVLYVAYNNVLVKITEDYLFFPKQTPGFTEIYFDSTKYDLRYFFEKRAIITWLIEQPKADKLDALEIFKYLITIDTDDFYRFEANMKIYEVANKPLIRRAFLSKAKSEKKLIGRWYKWMFGRDPDLPDSDEMIKQDAEEEKEEADREREEKDGN